MYYGQGWLISFCGVFVLLLECGYYRRVYVYLELLFCMGLENFDSKGLVDLTSCTLEYHSGMRQVCSYMGDLAGVRNSNKFVDRAKRIGASERFRYHTKIEDLEEMAMIDELTGLCNRRFFNEAIAQKVALARRGNMEDNSVIYFDIDHFKKFNDSEGHLAGDYVLSRLGKIVKNQMRVSDVSCRYGGEEFVIILSGTNVAGAYAAAEHLRERIEGKSWIYNGRDLGRVTISLGVAGINKGDSVEDVVERADERLYRAKENGRNQTVL
jgi:diguanylate cyclase